MKRGIMAAAGAAFGLIASVALAAPTGLDDGVYTPSRDAPALLKAHTFVCKAVSPVAYGVGYSPLLAQAEKIALTECAVRTPRGMVCVVAGCA